MKVGDKVILKKFETNLTLEWVKSLNKYVDKVAEVLSVDDNDGTFSIRDEECVVNEWWWLQSACEPIKNERYFMISYRANTGGIGNCFAKRLHGEFPKEKEIKSVVKKDHNIDITITSIFEFKSEQDYLDFTNNE